MAINEWLSDLLGVSIRVYLKGVVEDGVTLQQPGGTLQTARRGREIEPVGGVAYHP